VGEVERRIKKSSEPHPMGMTFMKEVGMFLEPRSMGMTNMIEVGMFFEHHPM
jgi:hypothetical protein